jgi:hypothetical protein
MGLPLESDHCHHSYLSDVALLQLLQTKQSPEGARFNSTSSNGGVSLSGSTLSRSPYTLVFFSRLFFWQRANEPLVSNWKGGKKGSERSGTTEPVSTLFHSHFSFRLLSLSPPPPLSSHSASSSHHFASPLPPSPSALVFISSSHNYGPLSWFLFARVSLPSC